MTTYLFEEMEIAEGSFTGMYNVEVEAEVEDGYDSDTGCGGYELSEFKILSVLKWNDELHKDEVIELSKEVIDFFENQIFCTGLEEDMVEYLVKDRNEYGEDEDWTNSRDEDYGL